MLQKYDAERDEAKLKLDLERDEAQRKFMAAMWGVELKDNPSQGHKPTPTDGRKRTMTKDDIMGNYGK